MRQKILFHGKRSFDGIRNNNHLVIRRCFVTSKKPLPCSGEGFRLFFLLVSRWQCQLMRIAFVSCFNAVNGGFIALTA